MTIPPVVQLLLKENLDILAKPELAIGRLKKGLFVELQKQAEWSFDHGADVYTANLPGTSEFSVIASGALDPFSADGPCRERGCRVSRVPTFLRTIGLWADRVYLRDVFVSQLRDAANTGHFSVADFASYVRVLRAIEPLIHTDIIRFTNTEFSYCDGCKTRVPSEATAELVENFANQFSFELFSGGLLARSKAKLDDVKLLFEIGTNEMHAAKALAQHRSGKRLTSAARKLRQALLCRYLEEQLRETFLDLIAAQDFQSALVSGSRTDLLCVKAIERGMPDIPTVEAWERAREVQIPWVSDLTAREVLVVRERAAAALPRFRERFARAMVVRTAPAALEDMALELRQDAVEVEAELAALAPKIRARERNAIAIISTAVALYGILTKL